MAGKLRSAQPIREEHLLTGPLEPTNEWYAVAKIAGIKLCQTYRRQYGFDAICAQPTNLYGPGDNFDLESSHVLPALIRKFHEAKVARAPEVTVWGTGTPRREFLHVDDLADALVFMMENYSGEEIVNVGTGEGLTIRELGEMVREAVGYEGALVFDGNFLLKAHAPPSNLMSSRPEKDLLQCTSNVLRRVFVLSVVAPQLTNPREAPTR